MIGLAVFSDHGAVKPEHIPHTDLQENINTSTNKIQIVHSGGEAIDRSAIKIILSIKIPEESELRHIEFSGSKLHFINPDGKESNPDDNVFALGDCIIIDTTDPDNQNKEDYLDDGLKINNSYAIDMFFVDTPSQQVIQKAVLQGGFGEIPYWITPHPYGSVYDNSTNEWLPTELVGAFNDGIFTQDSVPKKPAFVYEEFQFGIDADEMGISDPLKLVQLNVVYSSKDCSPNEIPISVYNGSEWTQIGQKMVENCEFTQSANFIYDISSAPSYVNTTEKLENLKVRFSASENASPNSGKFIRIDCVRIHVVF
jgi:Protein of unknown function (DUF1628).